MRIRALAAGLAALSLVALAACEGETPSLDDARKALEKAGTAVDKASELVKSLDQDKIRELARLAAEIEKEPGKAEELLEEHGLDREQFQKLVERIRQDPELAKIFDKAKELAGQAG